MRRLLIDGPSAGKIMDWDQNGPMWVADMKPLYMGVDDKFRSEEVAVEKTLYFPFDVFDPGDEMTGRAPGRLFVLVWELSPRIREYEEKSIPPSQSDLKRQAPGVVGCYGTPPEHPRCRSALNPVRALKDILIDNGVDPKDIDHESFDKAAKAMALGKVIRDKIREQSFDKAAEAQPGTDYEKLQHTEPNQNEDGTITGPDGKKRFL